MNLPELIAAVRDLLLCTELNLDDMEPDTRKAIERVEDALPDDDEPRQNPPCVYCGETDCAHPQDCPRRRSQMEEEARDFRERCEAGDVNAINQGEQ
jgi:hypothetical protein